MKKIFSIAFCVLLLCSMLLMVNVGSVLATEAGYSISEAYGGSGVTLDGKWGGTAGSEWVSTTSWLEKKFPTAANARFAYQMAMTDAGYGMSWLFEFHDTTNDAGDIWRLCIDGAGDGGAAPNTNDHKIEITGHTTLKVYQGNGTGWAPQTTTAVTWNNSLTTSPFDATNHWVVEIQVDKGVISGGGWGANPPPHGLFVAMYDASNPSQGWVQWPPTSPDNPQRWGTIADYMSEIPEGLSFAVVVALSSVAIVVGTIYLRKKPKTTSIALIKL